MRFLNAVAICIVLFVGAACAEEPAGNSLTGSVANQDLTTSSTLSAEADRSRGGRQNQDSTTTRDRPQSSVVKVHANDCEGGPDGIATGFVWDRPDRVVTALHAISGCSDLWVYFEQPGARRATRVSRVLRRADLALLTVDEPPEVSPLLLAETEPTDGDEVQAIGYYLNIPTANRKTLRLGFEGKRLKDIIPPKVRRQLQDFGYPDVDLEIINLEGHLLPGMSGGPVLNRAGELVAVVNGGLESGFVASSWGIPVRYLTQLLESDEAIPAATRRQVNSLFAVETASGDHPEVRCGELTFQRLRRKPFAQIAASTDDSLGLQQLLSVVRLPAPNFEVDIFQDVESGATFGVPSDLDLESRGDRCSITAAGGLRLDVKGFRIDAPPSSRQAWVAEVQEATVQFEEAVFNQAAYWQIDPQWSYWQPNFRADGLVVRRKAAGFFGEANYWNIPSQYAFETLVARGDAALGVSAQNARNLPLQTCILDLRPDLCPPMSQREAWSQLIVLTHLTTFPMH